MRLLIKNTLVAVALCVALSGLDTAAQDVVTTERVRVGTLVPDEGPLSEMGSAMKDVLTAYFAEMNNRGGINGRKVELLVGRSGLKKLLADGVFAMVGGLTAGADTESVNATKKSGVVWIGPSTLLPQNDASINPSIYYLTPGVQEQSRALVEFIASKPDFRDAAVHIIQGEGELFAEASDGVDYEAKKRGWMRIQKTVLNGQEFDARATASRLKQSGVGTVFLFAGSGTDVSFMKAAEELAWSPTIASIGAFASQALRTTMPKPLAGKFWLAFPSVPGDLTSDASSELQTLSQKHNFKLRHLGAQLSALASARVFTEVARAAGPELTRERFRKTLEGVRDFSTGVTPKITFSPNRRVGALGAYVLGINPQTREYVQAGSWIPLH